MLHQLRARHGAATGATLLFVHLPELLHSPDALALTLPALPREPRMRAALYGRLCGLADQGAGLHAQLRFLVSLNCAWHPKPALCALRRAACQLNNTLWCRACFPDRAGTLEQGQ